MIDMRVIEGGGGHLAHSSLREGIACICIVGVGLRIFIGLLIATLAG